MSIFTLLSKPLGELDQSSCRSSSHTSLLIRSGSHSLSSHPKMLAHEKSKTVDKKDGLVSIRYTHLHRTSNINMCPPDLGLPSLLGRLYALDEFLQEQGCSATSSRLSTDLRRRLF